jgi:hypothetical protein
MRIQIWQGKKKDSMSESIKNTCFNFNSMIYNFVMKLILGLVSELAL